MSIAELLRWQWSSYAKYHTSRTNLLIHIVAAPMFLIGNITFIAGLVQINKLTFGVGVALTVVGIALQGRGHKLEATPPEPFTSPANAVIRILLEQWITFPRFVLTGGWAAALK